MVQGGIFRGNFGYLTAVATALLVILSSFLYQHILSYDSVFPAITSLFKNKIGIMGIYTATLITAFLLTILFSKIILGRLTLLEVYVIHDNLLETCIEVLMITAMFRNIASEKFFLPLIHMVAVKYFHWMLKERVGNMDRLPIISFPYSLRILVLGNILFINDVKLAQYFSDKDLDNSFVQFIFYEQYAILVTYVMQNMAKFTLNFINSIKSEPMIFKTTIATCIDMFIYIFRAIIYVLFCIFFAMEQTLPIFIIIPLIKTILHGIQHGYTLVKTYYIFSEINKKCPFMSTAEVEALNDKTCIVCREDMQQARKLPCHHAFHSDCLMLWVQNGSNCPTCRKDIISASESSASNNGNNDARNEIINEVRNEVRNENIDARIVDNNITAQNEQPSSTSSHGKEEPNHTLTDITFNEVILPTNLKELIPVYQGMPTRLFNFVVKNDDIDSETTFKLINVRLLLKETDSLLFSKNYNASTDSSAFTDDSATTADGNEDKKERLQQALQNLSKAQTILQEELNKIP